MSGQELKAYRESRGLTQAQFAELVGLKRFRTITDFETGARPVPAWLTKMVQLLKERDGV
jgi:transcriptional regulator with XRE-family HTH domain